VRRRKLGFWRRFAVTVVAGAPIDLSRWDGGGAATAEMLHEITDTTMLTLRDMLAGIRREGPPPPLWTPAAQMPEEAR